MCLCGCEQSFLFYFESLEPKGRLRGRRAEGGKGKTGKEKKEEKEEGRMLRCCC